jgi:hypothetical protein
LSNWQPQDHEPIFNIPGLPEAKLANEIILVWLECGAEFAFPPARQLAGVQLVHSDAAVRHRTLVNSAQRRTFPLRFHSRDSTFEPPVRVYILLSPDWRERHSKLLSRPGGAMTRRDGSTVRSVTVNIK